MHAWARVSLLVCTLAAAAHSGGATAASLSSSGITFSDELGGFTVVSAAGSGTLADPFVVVEEITGPQEPVLVIRGLSAAFGNRIGSHHLTGFALTKIVVNKTDDDWNLFEMELRETLAHESPYGDGLSFGQGSTVGHPFISDKFPTVNEIDEPSDSVAFRDATVHPGESVSFHLVITDTSPVSPFLLLQQPTRIVATGPQPLLAMAASGARPAADGHLHQYSNK
jgi:hypothetical protein